MKNNFGLITILALIVLPSIGKVASAQVPQLKVDTFYTSSPQDVQFSPKLIHLNTFNTLFLDVIKTRDKHTTYLAAVKEKARLAAIEKQKEEQAALQLPAQEKPSSNYIPQVYNPSSVQSMIIHWANVYGVSSSWMLGIAKCESSFNPSETYLGHLGLYQYLPETFAGYSASAGVSGSIWDADTQAHVTAWALANGHAGAWTCA